MRIDLDRIKIVVGLRMARAAVGWSQEELAQKMGVAKTTIARIEIGEVLLSAEQYFKFERLYNNEGLSMRLMMSDDVTVSVNETALLHAQARLADVGLKRSDRKKPIRSEANIASEGSKIVANKDKK